MLTLIFNDGILSLSNERQALNYYIIKGIIKMENLLKEINALGYHTEKDQTTSDLQFSVYSKDEKTLLVSVYEDLYMLQGGEIDSELTHVLEKHYK